MLTVSVSVIDADEMEVVLSNPAKLYTTADFTLKIAAGSNHVPETDFDVVNDTPNTHYTITLKNSEEVANLETVTVTVGGSSKTSLPYKTQDQLDVETAVALITPTTIANINVVKGDGASDALKETAIKAFVDNIAGMSAKAVTTAVAAGTAGNTGKWVVTISKGTAQEATVVLTVTEFTDNSAANDEAAKAAAYKSDGFTAVDGNLVHTPAAAPASATITLTSVTVGTGSEITGANIASAGFAMADLGVMTIPTKALVEAADLTGGIVIKFTAEVGGVTSSEATLTIPANAAPITGL